MRSIERILVSTIGLDELREHVGPVTGGDPLRLQPWGIAVHVVPATAFNMFDFIVEYDDGSMEGHVRGRDIILGVRP